MTAFSNNWMWSEACEVLARDEGLHREFSRPSGSVAGLPTWEPPADVLETEDEVLVLLALPGVDPEQVEALIDNGYLAVSGSRILPAALRTAVIHRLELPRGVSNGACVCRQGTMRMCGGPVRTGAS